MALLWTFVLLLTPLLAAQNQEEPDPSTSGEPQETGKKCSLLSPQEKVSLLSCCKVGACLYHVQDAVAVSERIGADVHTRAQNTWASAWFWWREALFGDGGQQSLVCWESLCRGHKVPPQSGKCPWEHKMAISLCRMCRCHVLTTVEMGASAQQRPGEP